ILGCVAIARSRIETVDEVRDRLTEALRHIDRERLVAAPDCGLGYLGRDLAIAKLQVLCEAASSV
ncbi:MAG TPA: 5-methyltetrahydropteroyltriglutamate--homocysteine methyltransferase, partial [Acidimicrobiaceae bacterium]|nr:5-methyltetrahydropteroyltriglutamate--homocysteine methyltransferase [Acidimicrobiaceae bacterium]